MTTDFNINNLARANREGWTVSYSDVHGYQLQKLDEVATFKSDGDAVLFVTDMAFEYRSDYHRDAIEFLIDHGGRPENN